MIKFFWNKTPSERAKDHINKAGSVFAWNNMKGNSTSSNQIANNDQIKEEIAYWEMQGKASAKEGGVKGWEHAQQKIKELQSKL